MAIALVVVPGAALDILVEAWHGCIQPAMVKVRKDQHGIRYILYMLVDTICYLASCSGYISTWQSIHGSHANMVNFFGRVTPSSSRSRLHTLSLTTKLRHQLSLM